MEMDILDLPVLLIRSAMVQAKSTPLLAWKRLHLRLTAVLYYTNPYCTASD